MERIARGNREHEIKRGSLKQARGHGNPDLKRRAGSRWRTERAKGIGNGYNTGEYPR